eukprot:3978082-Pyramimonas_sp.AAC.1
MSFAARRQLRDHLAFDAPLCQLAYMMHGAAVSPDRAEELRLADAVSQAAQRKAGLGRWRAAFPAAVQYPEDGPYPSAML